MTDKKSNDSRRKLLKSIAAGSGAVVAGKSLPESWAKPVVDSVMLPAHAETTEAGSEGDDTNCVVYAVSHVEFESNYGVGLLTVCATVCGESAEVTHAVDFEGEGYNQRSGTIPVGGATGQMPETAHSPCDPDDPPPSRSATLTGLTANSVVFTMKRGKNAPGDLVVTLKRVDSCPSFSPLNYGCDN